MLTWSSFYLTAESELEVAFFRDLQTELKKISLFYAAEEKRCSFRYQQLRSVLKNLKVRGSYGYLIDYLLLIAV